MFFLYVLIIYLLIDFIYKKIILPSIRQQYRDKLFQIRDQVRLRIIEGGLNKENLAAANLMNSNLNGFINRLHILNLNNRIRIKILMKDHPDIANKLEQDTKREFDLLVSCSDEVIRSCFIDMMDVLKRAYIFNNLIIILTWIPIILPVMTLYSLYKLFTRSIKGFWAGILEDIGRFSIKAEKMEKLDERYRERFA